MRPQDVVILLKKITPDGRNMSGKQLAESLSISPSEISEAADRNLLAGLLDAKKERVNVLALKDFLIYGIRYCFPAYLGPVVRGIPTAVSASPIKDKILSGSDTYVWPDKSGSFRGQSVEPLYHTVPQAVAIAPKLYELLVITDTLRMGKVRERDIAISELDKYLNAYAAG